MKRINASELTSKYEGHRISFNLGDTYVAGKLLELHSPDSYNSPTISVEGIYDLVVLGPSDSVTIFGA